MSNRHSLLAFFVLGTAACGPLPEPREAELVPVQRTSALSTSDWWVIDDRSYVTIEWNSGQTTSLSSWQTLDCTETFGEQHLLRVLTGYREPSSNLDNFVARLEGTCTRYEFSCENCVRKTDRTRQLIYSGNHRTTAYTASVSNWGGDTGNLASGFLVEVNKGNDYIKDLRFRASNATDNDFVVRQDYHGPFTGDDLFATEEYEFHELDCPEWYVLSGIKLKYDTRNGKIRHIQGLCRELMINRLY